MNRSSFLIRHWLITLTVVLVALCCIWEFPQKNRIRTVVGSEFPAIAVDIFATPKAPGADELALGQKFLREGQTELALAAFDLSIKGLGGGTPSGPDRFLAGAYLGKAKALMDLGQTDKAIEAYSTAVTLDPQYAEAYYGRGAAFLHKGCPELAIDDLNEACNLAPPVWQEACLRARADLEAGKYEEAVDNGRLAIRLCNTGGDHLPQTAPAADQGPGKDVAYVKEAIMLSDKLRVSSDKSALARAYSQWSEQLCKDDRRAEAELALAEAGRLDPQLAIRQPSNFPLNPKRRIVGYAPQSSNPKFPHAMDLLVKNDKQAITAFTAMLDSEDSRNDIWVWWGRGSAYLNGGDTDAAIADFERAIDLAPRFAAAYSLRGQAYLCKGNPNQAIADLTQAIRINPRDGLAYYYRALAYLKIGSFQRAQTDFLESEPGDRWPPALDHSFDPKTNFTKAVKEQGLAYLDQGHWDDAIDCLKRAVAIDPRLTSSLHPEVAKAYAERGFEQFDARRWGEAVESFEKAIDYQRSLDVQLRLKLATAYAERGFQRADRGEFAAARTDVKTAYELGPEDARVSCLTGESICLIARGLRGQISAREELRLWVSAGDYLKFAIGLQPRLDYELRPWTGEAEQGRQRLSQASPSH